MTATGLAQASRIALACVFLAAAPHKILVPAEFAQSLSSYQILPDMLINFIALTLPWLEMLVAFLLLCQVWTGPSLLLANAMLTVFLGALVLAYVRGIDIACGCFSSLRTPSDAMTLYIARDAAFLVLGLIAAWLHANGLKRKTLDG